MAPERAVSSLIGFSLRGRFGRRAEGRVHSTGIGRRLAMNLCLDQRYNRLGVRASGAELRLVVDYPVADRGGRIIRYFTAGRPGRPLGEVVHIDAVCRGEADEARQVVRQQGDHAERHQRRDHMGHHEDRRAGRRCR